MRSAPPAIEVQLGDARPERLAVSALYALALGTLGGWLPAGLGSVGASSASALALVAACALAGMVLGGLSAGRIWQAPRGLLRWNGRVWTLADGVGNVELRLDCGNWLLLRFKAPGARSIWFGLHAADQGSSWHGLRVALLHAGSAAGVTEGSDNGTPSAP